MIVKRRTSIQKEFGAIGGFGKLRANGFGKYGKSGNRAPRKITPSKPKVDVTHNNRLKLGQAPTGVESVSVMKNPTTGFDFSGTTFNPSAVKPQTVTPSPTIQPKPIVENPIIPPTTNSIQSPILQSAGPTKPIIDLPLPGLAQSPVNNSFLGPVQVKTPMSTKTISPTVIKSKPVEVAQSTVKGTGFESAVTGIKSKPVEVPSPTGSSITTTTTTTNTNSSTGTGNNNSKNKNKGWFGKELKNEGKRFGKFALGTTAAAGAGLLAVPMIAANSEYGIHDV